MRNKKFRRVLASVSAVAMLAGAMAAPVMSVSADQLLYETSFDYKSLPWHTCESSPAKQVFAIEDGTFHVKILNPKGADGEIWDLQTRYRNLGFKAGHTYKVSFRAKAKRAGMKLYSKIGSINGREEYFSIHTDKMDMGPSMEGDWGEPAELTTEFKEYSGTFTPTYDIEGAEWAFHYAEGKIVDGNAQKGDEIWFDDMSIEGECGFIDSFDYGYGAVDRDYSASVDSQTYKPNGKLNNFISVNQLGYYSCLSKVAVLGDNKGDILHCSSSIDLTKDTYDFDVCDAESGESVYKGKSERKMKDADSGDTVCNLDFSTFKKPGTYYIRVGEWRSLPFKIGNDIYSNKYGKDNDMLTNAMNYFYQNRSGIDITKEYITSGEDKELLAHQGSHKKDTASVQSIWKNDYFDKADTEQTNASSKITATGGWYSAGNFSKNVVDGGISVWTLQNMYERAIQTEDGVKKFADASGTVVIPESGNKIPDVLDEAAYELDWMSKMVVQADDPAWGNYAGLVYHSLCDDKWTGLAVRPYDYGAMYGTSRIVKPPTFAATLNYAACAAQAARLWKPYDAEKAAMYLDEAKKAYQAYEKYWYQAKTDEEQNDKSLYAPLYKADSNVLYNTSDTTDIRDEAYWAACEIFVSAKRMDDPAAHDYYLKLYDFNDAFRVSTRIIGARSCEATLSTFNSDSTGSAGSLTLALNKDLLSQAEAKKLEDSITYAADTYIETENKQGYRIPYLYDGPGYNNPDGFDSSAIIKGYEYASNSMVVNNAVVMAYAYDQTKDDRYINGVTAAMDYILGTNPLSFSYITGYGTYYEKNPHHKYWAYEIDKCFPKAPDGVLSGGPNAGLEDNYIRALGFNPGNDNTPSQRCFVDSIESWSTNQVAINWNSQLAWVVSFIQDEMDPDRPPVNPVTTEPATTAPQVTGQVTTRTETTKPVTTMTKTTKPVTTMTKTTKPVTTMTETTKPVTTPPVTPEDPGEVTYGDVDLNGEVDVSDLIRLSQHLLGDIRLSGKALKAADCDGNGMIEITDLPRLRQYIMKDKITLGPKQ